MRLKEALRNDGAAQGLAEATLARLGLTDEAAVAMTDEGHALTGGVPVPPPARGSHADARGTAERSAG